MLLFCSQINFNNNNNNNNASIYNAHNVSPDAESEALVADSRGRMVGG